MQTLMANAKSESMEVLRDRVRKILDARNMTIQDLADAMNRPRPYLSKVLGGKHDPTISYVEEIANALHVKLVDLFSKEKNSKKLA